MAQERVGEKMAELGERLHHFWIGSEDRKQMMMLMQEAFSWDAAERDSRRRGG
jgi:hypothetical protein